MAQSKDITRHTSETANNMYEELCKRRNGVLATIDKNCTPHLTVVYYLIDEDFSIWFATKRQTLKHRNLSARPDVRLLVYDEKSQTTIQVSGRAFKTEDRKQEQKVIEHVYAAAAENQFRAPPISKLYAGDYVCYKIEPSHISMGIFTRPQRGGYDMFETLDFDD